MINEYVTTEFKSKSSALRCFVYEELKEANNSISKKELKSKVEKRFNELSLGEITEALFSETLKRLTAPSDSPVQKDLFKRGNYKFNKVNDKGFDVLEESVKVANSGGNTEKPSKLTNDIKKILESAQKEIKELIANETVPMSVLLDGNSDELEKYKEKIREIDEVIQELSVLARR